MRWPFCPQGAVSCSSNLRFQVQTNQIVCFYCIKSYCTGAFGELGYTLPLRNIRSPQGLKSHFGLYSLWSKEKVVCDASDSSGKNFTVDRATSGDLPLVTEVWKKWGTGRLDIYQNYSQAPCRPWPLAGVCLVICWKEARSKVSPTIERSGTHPQIKGMHSPVVSAPRSS